jgi:hypothetical protein
MGTLHFKLGEGLGLTLLEIAQENILKGKSQDAIKTYTDYLHGCEEKYAIMLIKGEAVLETDNDGVNMNFTTDKAKVEANKKHIYDWKNIIQNKYLELQLTYKALLTNDNKFYDVSKADIIDDYDITKMMKRYFDDQQMTEIGVHHIAAKLIGGGCFNNQASNGEMLWDRLCEEVESGEYAPKYEYLLYYTVKHNEFIRKLSKSFIEFDNIYRFLLKYEMIDRLPSIEDTIEGILEELVRFIDINRGYYHPMCNMGLANIKTEIKHDLEKSEYYQEYMDFGLIRKNILDGYDSGWLSPEGEFFGYNGETSSMIHMNLAEKLFETKKYGELMRADGTSRFSVDSPERWLEKHGWVKIHHQDCYGSFIGDKDWTEYPYCPTPIQIKLMCAYADKHYNGKFYTEYASFGSRVSHPEPHLTYKVKQMDEIMLHKIFGH